MKISAAGIAFIKRFEGCRLTAYRDVASVLTIGYGYTGPDVYEGMKITQAQADQMLLDRLNNEFCPKVTEAIGDAPTTQAQFDAMVSLAYNIGTGRIDHHHGVGGFDGSSVLREHLAKNYAAAADDFLLWNKAGGKVIAGLVRRRHEERALYLSGSPA